MNFTEFVANPPTEIVKYPAPILKQTALPVPEVNDEVRAAIAIMFRLMYEWHGVGLAAPQVGLPYQLFVANSGEKEHAFINPEVIHRGIRTASRVEGCLSLPGIHVAVERPHRFLFRALDAQGKMNKHAYEGLMGCICQHEYDHLHGILIIDKIQDIDRIKPVLDKLTAEQESGNS